MVLEVIEKLPRASVADAERKILFKYSTGGLRAPFYYLLTYDGHEMDVLAWEEAYAHAAPVTNEFEMVYIWNIVGVKIPPQLENKREEINQIVKEIFEACVYHKPLSKVASLTINFDRPYVSGEERAKKRREQLELENTTPEQKSITTLKD